MSLDAFQRDAIAFVRMCHSTSITHACTIPIFTPSLSITAVATSVASVTSSPILQATNKLINQCNAWLYAPVTHILARFE